MLRNVQCYILVNAYQVHVYCISTPQLAVSAVGVVLRRGLLRRLWLSGFTFRRFSALSIRTTTILV